MAGHAQDVHHPPHPKSEFLTVLPIDLTKNKRDILEREVRWQQNLGIHKFGLKNINDFTTVSRKIKENYGITERYTSLPCLTVF